MIDELTEERSDLEHKLLQEQSNVQKLRETLETSKRKLAALKTAKPVEEDTAAVLLSVAQELRTPLSSIAAYVDLLLGESVGILGEMQRQFLQRVKANGDRLTALIEDFVRVVAIDTGQLKFKSAPVDMLEVIDDAITATRTQFREKGITLKLEMQENLPPLEGDQGALQQVIVELLSNAYRASPTDGEVAVNAHVEMNYKFPARNGTEQVAHGVLIAVKDMGGGVPAEEQSRVFGRLYRADKPLVQGLGDTGVGLSIARALTEMHGGRIWLETTPGESSTFMLVIPLHALEEAEKKADYVAS